MRDDDREKNRTGSERESAEREREAEQQRGRERMIALWRAAVECVTEAARREAATPRSAEADRDDERERDEPAVATWSFPPKTRAAS